MLQTTPTSPDAKSAGEDLDLDRLGHALDRDGVHAHRDALRTVAALALAAGVSPTLVRIVTCDSEPPIARLRAFGRLAGALGRSPAGALAHPGGVRRIAAA